MKLTNALNAMQTLRGRSLGHDLHRVVASPRRAWNSMRRWALLARHAGLPYVDLVRYRRELLDDGDFQAHMQRCLEDVPYVFSGLPELHAVMRALKPRVVVETGVASGMSSAHILRALAANGMGTLHSIDLPNVQKGSVLPAGRQSGWIVPAALRSRWDLRIGDSRTLLPELLQSLPCIDVFLHDSDHSYENMMFEYELAYPRLEPGGLLLSDDTHMNAAWDDFCIRQGLEPTRVENLGVMRKPREARASSASGKADTH
jgi:methyltransferase family protein